MKLDTEIACSKADPFREKLDVLVVAVPYEISDECLAAEFDRKIGGKFRKAIENEFVSKEALKTSVWYGPDNVAAKSVVTVGIGKDINPRSVYRAAAAAIKFVGSTQGEIVGVAGFPLDEDSPLCVDSVVIGCLVGAIGQDLYRDKKNLRPPKKVILFADRDIDTSRGEAIAVGIAMTRHLVNQAPNHMYPASFVDQTLEQLAGTALQSEVWDEEKLREERCESMLAVGRASDKPPRLLILKYQGTEAGKGMAPIALVGKGVTFDSGGLSIKPTDSMLTMKCDMAGGATVVGVMFALASLKIARPVLALVGLVENVISGNAYKLGDILHSRAGKSIEVHNTDAEGRLVLADVLNVALDHKPSKIVDFATLTGACVVALGTDVGGLMVNNDELADEIEESAKQVGEYIWQLPMFPLFDEQIQGKVADLKNVGDGRWGGAITAAKFLEQFVGETPWAHIDLAGPAFADKPKGWCDAGGTGYMVHTITNWLAKDPQA